MILKMITRIIIVTLIGAFISVSHAGSLDELYASLIEKKRAQIEQALDLEDNDAFWEVYDKFQAKQSEYDHDAFNLNKKFQDKQEAGEISAQSMINLQAEFFRIEGRILQNKQNQAEFFAHTLSKEDMFRFYQIESKLEALIRSEIAHQAPMFASDVSLD